MFRHVQIGTFVDKKGGFAEHAETVGKARRDPELPFILSGQNNSVPAPEGRRVCPDVDRHIKDLSLHDVNQLFLGVRILKMEAAQYSLPGKGKIVLHKIRGNSSGRIPVPLPGLLKKAAPVAIDIGFHHDETRYCYGGKFHFQPSS